MTPTKGICSARMLGTRRPCRFETFGDFWSTSYSPLREYRRHSGATIPGQGSWGSSTVLSPDGSLIAAIVRGADGQPRLGTRRLDQNQVQGTLSWRRFAAASFLIRMPGRHRRVIRG